MITFYVLHRSDNFIATEIWDRQFEASWGTFMPTFSKLYWTFFKYAVILFLAKQVLLIFRLLPFSDAAKLITVPETKAALSDQSDKELTAQRDREVENALPPLEKVDRSNERWDSSGLLPVRVGRVTYILDVFNIVYLEVHDDTTTVYQKDGSDIAVKYPLSKFYNRLPKGRFVRVNESRVVALPYVWKDNDGHIYMRTYEDKGLKLGRQDKFPEYKEWKDRNKLK
ncbi:LytTR family DNA-binding domain-containing protein [Sphingobacterium haloxyli]|uniref:HTH LytTR-type domain-containing protein n=1 Tax=Sphingobacterium haloxyli TaxID=2100533 RepID=A0A2S9J1D1_9SPHI|nr:LytTR family DNA-binding domain-containing protein [Sphingobacterium haloxyli]PRD46592.1 hypothetical protein C5745_14655 [Sphingobacterium haloxyli]